MDHRLQGSSSAPNPFNIYHPFISPSAYIPAIAARPERPISSKPITSFPASSLSKPHTDINKSNFSINRILQPAAATAVSCADAVSSPSAISIHQQQKSLIDTAAKMLWLQQLASVPHHPILSRQTPDLKKVAKKRKLGRNPRIPFTQQQIELLERRYADNRYLSSMDVVELSKSLQLSEARVKIWFQNRRARERRDHKSTKCLPTSSLTESMPASTTMMSLPGETSSSEVGMQWNRQAASSTASASDDLMPADYTDSRMRHLSPVCKLEVVSDTD